MKRIVKFFKELRRHWEILYEIFSHSRMLRSLSGKQDGYRHRAPSPARAMIIDTCDPTPVLRVTASPRSGLACLGLPYLAPFL